MTGLAPSALLAACERGRGLNPIDRALCLVASASPDAEVTMLPLAERDRRLLAIRVSLLGDRLDCVADCPVCGAALEFALSATETAAGIAAPTPERWTSEGWEIEFRPLDSRDLAEAARAPDADAAEAILAARAVVALRAPAGMSADNLPPESVRAAAAARAAEREAAGVVELELGCVECGAAWPAPLDIAGHVWAEAEAAAGRLLAEVAALAARYGWSEAELLAMPPARRSAYLDIAV